MRSIYIILLMFAAFVGCKSGDEAPQETSPLVSLLGLNLVTGYGWTGELTSQSCSADTVQNTVLTCPFFNALEAQTVAAVPKNGTLILQLNSNRLAGAFTFVLPNYNLIPTNVYYITSNLTTEQGYDTGSGAVTTIRYQSTVSTQTSASTTNVEILDFAATQDPAYLTGNMKLRFSSPTNPSAGALVATYGFKFDKLF